MMKNKTRVVAVVIIGTILMWNHLPYYYNNEKVVDYATNHASPNSRTMCAGYVIRAMWHGGCPIGLVPAYAYSKILPQIGFQEVIENGYKAQRGDICVLPQNKRSSFGHIAVYNGRVWVSDFKQKSIYPSWVYREDGRCQYFRATDGWHWKHVWTTPLDWFGWVKALYDGFDRIKFRTR